MSSTGTFPEDAELVPVREYNAEKVQLDVLKEFFRDLCSNVPGTSSTPAAAALKSVKIKILQMLSLSELGQLRLVNRRLNNVVVKEVLPGKKSIQIRLSNEDSLLAPSPPNCYNFRSQILAQELLFCHHRGVKELSIISDTDQTIVSLLSPNFFSRSFRLTKVRLTMVEIQPRLISKLGEHQPLLETLDLQGCKYNGAGLADLGTNLRELIIVRCTVPSLRSLAQAMEIFQRRGQQLTTLKFVSDRPNEYVNFPDYSLLTFVLENCTAMQHFQLEAVKVNGALVRPIVATNLVSLELNSLHSAGDFDTELYPHLFAQPLPNLRKLRLNNNRQRQLTAHMFKRVVAAAPNLEEIGVSFAGNFGDSFEDCIQLPKLKCVNIRAQLINIEHVLKLIEKSPPLWQLSVADLYQYPVIDRNDDPRLWSVLDEDKLYRRLRLIAAQHKRERLFALNLPIPYYEARFLRRDLAKANIILNQEIAQRPPGYLMKADEDIFRYLKCY